MKRLAVPRSWKQVLATSLAMVFGIVAGVDIVGTPLAIVAIKHAEHASDQAQLFAQRANTATIHAREQDCEGAEKLRELGRKRIKQKRRELPATLALLHLKPTPQVRAISEAGFKAEEAALAPVNCYVYGHEAQP